MKINKKFFLFIFIVLIIVIAGIIGIVYKSTYDNPLADEKSFDKISVSLFEERNIGIIEGTLAGTIKGETQYVYKIVITEDYEFDFQSLTQKAKILEVFKGDGVVGDEITIYDSCWHLFDDNYMNTGFTSLMKKGEEYLVYFMCKNNNELHGEYYTIEAYTIAPYFSYKNKENYIPEEYKSAQYIDYGLVKNNEFFAENKKVEDAYYVFKETMMEEYNQKAE